MKSIPPRQSESPSGRPVTSAALRRAFVRFFEERGHRQVPSSSLVPHNDPTVLLTTAGMQQMTPYFLGLETPPAPRMITIQKCFRTVDIDEVGDESHCTFFFMLGNFSVGDYFKAESLAWSWEFLTQVVGLPPDRFLPSVYPDDEDSLALWRDRIGIPAAKIQISGQNNTYLAPEDNWWGPVGPTGPCGPDSEIYFDWGAVDGAPADDAPGSETGRFLEVWNNVFMEFFKGPDGKLTPLPKQNVDTGMGLERLAMVAQGKKSIYDTDLYQPIIQRAAALAKTTYGENPEHDRALRVVADHARGGTFLIADGVLPGNEGRSYVLRRILRRAIRFARLGLGLEEPFLAEMAEIVVAQFGAEFPELRERQNQIKRTLGHEEESFGRTLAAGSSRLMSAITKVTEATRPVREMVDKVDDATRDILETVRIAQNERDRQMKLGRDAASEVDRQLAQVDEVRRVLPGDEVFRLYDTFGFPYDLTLEIAKEQGVEVDQAGFETAMAVQRETSRGGAAFKDATRGRAEFYAALGAGKSAFLGYEDARSEAKILALVGPAGAVEEAQAGQPVEVVLDRTPFYGESGGQIGDTGTIRTETGLIRVEDTQRPLPDLVVHRGVVEEGFVRTGERATAEIDAERRAAIRRNHTATHLLHKALQLVVGPDARQAGSLVAPDRLRFDFTSHDAVRPEQIRRVAEIVNGEVYADSPVSAEVKPIKEAMADGAMALFGEKYGDEVRVVTIPGFSMELCGGTHVRRTGEIGPFLITGEGSVSAGIRRIEALTGAAAVALLLDQQRTVTDLGRDLRVTWQETPAAVAGLSDRLRAAEREAERLRGQVAASRAGDLLADAVALDGTRVLAARVEADSKDALRQLGDRLRDRLDSGVVVLGTVVNGQPSLLAMVTQDLIKRGVRAGDLVREAAAILDGRGGGRPDLAEAGGKDATKLDEALGAVEGIVKRALAG